MRITMAVQTVVNQAVGTKDKTSPSEGPSGILFVLTIILNEQTII